VGSEMFIIYSDTGGGNKYLPIARVRRAGGGLSAEGFPN
jgi:hypothetical protein